MPRITGIVTFRNPDENWGASARVLTGDLSANASQNLPLINYINAASFVPLYAIGRLVGVWHGTADFRAQYFDDPTPFIFAGRFAAACLGALSGPLAVLIAGRLGLAWKSSLIVGGMVALFPINVWLTHIAKPDGGVAFAILLLAWSILRKLDLPDAKGADVVIGVAVALAISFKQTAVFVVAPMLVGFVALMRRQCKVAWPRIARGLLATSVACMLLWVPLNTGVWLDIKSFLDWQRFSAIVNSRPATPLRTLERVVEVLAHNVTGLTSPGLVVWLLAPLVRRDSRFLALWGSTMFAYVTFSPIMGTQVVPRYLLPFDELAFTIACIALLTLVERPGPARLVGLCMTGLILASEASGSADVVRQAMTTPMPARCSKVLEAIALPEQDRILAADGYLLGVPISKAAADDEFERGKRLASKYGLELPPRPKEKAARRDKFARSYYVRSIPFVLGGMQHLTAEVQETIAKPHCYPLQEEEWDLDYWAERGFTLFVVRDEEGGFVASSPFYLSLHKQIRERCDLVAELPSTRRLFWEGEVRIYRLSHPSGPMQSVAPDSSGSRREAMKAHHAGSPQG